MSFKFLVNTENKTIILTIEPIKYSGNYMHHVVLLERVCVFRMVLAINSDCFP
jgi:hypothetical protein